MFAPICLFTYNRLKETKLTIEALQKNHLAVNSDLFIFSDGSKNTLDDERVRAVRNFLDAIDGFKSVTIFHANTNKGLSESIINGVSHILNTHDTVIVLEDDLITAPNFLDFMNQGLTFYAKTNQIFSISGYTMNLPSLKNYPKDFYLGHRASSWGWGIWRDRWDKIDWSISDYNSFKLNIKTQLKFMRGGSDMPSMLRKQINGKLDSWAIRVGYHQFKYNLLTIFPTTSKLKSIGFGDDATHTKNIARFKTFLDSGIKKEFKFENDIVIDKNLIREFRLKFSFLSRLTNKLKSFF